MVKKANILIVDDLPENLKLLAELITTEGYHARPVPSGKLALIAAEAMPPDLILLDINMPVMDGFETCEKLKKSEITKDIPVIFLSANIESSAIIKGFEMGAVDYMTKPFQAMEVLLRIKTQLELKFSKEEVIEKNHEQQELLHILCHDLLNSVGAVKSILEIKKMDNELCQYDELMLGTIDNAVKVIGLVRELRSIEEKKVSVKLSLINLKELIDESLAIIHQKIEKKSIEIVINMDESCEVLVERISFINSVLNNLLTNAIKFSFENSKIMIFAEQRQKIVYLSIKDFGIGMPKALQQNLFRIDKVTTRQGTDGEQGTGFGMPLVKKFMMAYGAEIEIKSQEKTADSDNHGTEIILALNVTSEH